MVLSASGSPAPSAFGWPHSPPGTGGIESPARKARRWFYRTGPRIDQGDRGFWSPGRIRRSYSPCPGGSLPSSSLQFGVGGAVDLTHAALAELGGDFVMGDGLVDHGVGLP